MTPELPSAHIWGLVCGYATPYRRRKLLLMLKGYIDDSGGRAVPPPTSCWRGMSYLPKYGHTSPTNGLRNCCAAGRLNIFT